MADMDARNPEAGQDLAARAPLQIGAVALGVRDLDRVAAFYCDVIGLSVLDRPPGTARLGAGSMVRLVLEHRPDARPDDPREAGLYHTAFLMPARRDLARWLGRVARRRTPISGAADHHVSEAVYLDDPEGNGVEVYADRRREHWRWEDGRVVLARDPLDIDGLLGVADGDYQRAPDGLRVGHVHLRVGDVAAADGFYGEAVGLAVTCRRRDASFLSSGGYHHHVAANVWHSAGAGRRDPARAGLAWFSLEAGDGGVRDALAARLRSRGAEVRQGADGLETADPWGTRVRLA